MKGLLFVKKLYLHVFTTKKSKSKYNEKLNFEHQYVYGFIRQYVEDNVNNHITNEQNEKSLWTKIKSLCASNQGIINSIC